MEIWCSKEKFFGAWRSFASSIDEPCRRRYSLMKLYNFENARR